MHVLFITKWYPGRNDPQLGVFIQKHALAVGKQISTSVIFAHPVKGQTQELLIDRHLNENVLELKAYYKQDESENFILRKVKNFLRLRKAYLRAFDELVAERGLPELSHVHILIRPILLALLLKGKHKIPFLVSEQSSDFLNGKFQDKNGLLKGFVRWSMKQASAYTAVSSHLSDGMRNAGLKGEYNIVPNVLPLSENPLAAAGPAHHFLMVADLVDETKNISGVLHAIASLAQKHPKVKLDIIGGGADQAKLHELVEELGITKHVQFFGRLPNNQVLEIMRDCGTVVINSRYETFSVVTGEALMLGKPVVSTRCGGPNDMVKPVNGSLVPVDDRGALEMAMEKVMLEHATFDPLKIRESVGANTSSEAVGKRFLSIYEGILK